MYRKTFVCLCRQTISRTYTIFYTVHAMSDINNMYQFQDIWRIFTRVKSADAVFWLSKTITSWEEGKKRENGDSSSGDND